MQPPISRSQIEQFNRTGFLRLDEAFPRPLAAAAREILWKDLPVDRNHRSTWTDPVHHLGMYGDAPFVASANTPRLRAAVSAYRASRNGEPGLPDRFREGRPLGKRRTTLGALTVGIGARSVGFPFAGTVDDIRAGDISTVGR